METNNKYFLPAAVIIAGLFIAGAVLWSGSHPTSTAGGAVPTPAAALKVNIKDVKTAGDPFIGKADAPITIAFWSDYQCPFCKKFETETLPQIVKNYVDTGKAKIVFMDFPFLGNDSVSGALYARAIWKLYPDKFFVWHEKMTAAQDQENGGFGTATSIDKLNATIAGVDAAKVAADVKANTSAYQAMIDSDKAELAKVSANQATPSFVIGTQMIAGAYPYTAFQSALDAVK